MSYRPLQPFAPYRWRATQALSVSNASGRVALPANTRQVLLTTIANDALIFVEFGGSSCHGRGPLGRHPRRHAGQWRRRADVQRSAQCHLSGRHHRRAARPALYITPGEGI